MGAAGSDPGEEGYLCWPASLPGKEEQQVSSSGEEEQRALSSGEEELRASSLDEEEWQGFIWMSRVVSRQGCKAV